MRRQGANGADSPTAEPRDPRKVHERALTMLSARARSARDLKARLLRAGEPEEVVDAVIERLLASGILDDLTFARQVVRAKGLTGGLSKQRVRQELYRRGVPKDVGEAAIEEVWEEEQIDSTATIEALAQKKLRTLGAVDVPTKRRRLYGFLARRGYPADEIARALARVILAAD